jgi:hypothetical protein
MTTVNEEAFRRSVRLTFAIPIVTHMAIWKTVTTRGASSLFRGHGIILPVMVHSVGILKLCIGIMGDGSECAEKGNLIFFLLFDRKCESRRINANLSIPLFDLNIQIR